MPDGVVGIDEPTTIDKRIDNTELTVGVNTVQRQRIIIAGPAATDLAAADAANGLDVDVTRLPALVAGSANIGDVDVLTVPAPLSTSGGGTEAAALRVTLANDSTGLVSVDDNAGSLTIDAVSLPLPAGAATAALQTQPGVDIGDVTINNAGAGAAVNVQDGGNSVTVDAPVGTPVAARLSDGAAFLTTVSGRLAVDPTGTNTPVIGTSGDDAINSTTKLPVLPARSNAAAPAWSETRQVPLSVELNGGLRVNPIFGKTLKTASISVAASGDNTIVAAVASKRIKVYAINLSAVGTVSVKWKDGAATDFQGAQDLQAREGYTLSVSPPAFLLGTTAGNALILNLSAAVGVRGWIAYWDDDGT